MMSLFLTAAVAWLFKFFQDYWPFFQKLFAWVFLNNSINAGVYRENIEPIYSLFVVYTLVLIKCHNFGGRSNKSVQ